MKRFFNVWVLMGLGIFYFGPIAWPGAQQPWVAVIAIISLLGFNLGSVAVGSIPASPRDFPRAHTRKAALIVVAAHGGLSLTLLAFSTGRSVFSTSAYTLDFGAAYANYAQFSEQVALGSTEMVLLVMKAALFPFALMAAIERFGRDHTLIALFATPLVISSLFRGTDKEMIDLLIFVAVAAYLHGMLTWRRIAAGLLLCSGALYLFLLRRLGRYNDQLPNCIPSSGTCFNYDSWPARHFGDQAEVLRVFVSSYVTNGYQGLSLAVQLPWDFNWGVGHLPIIKANLCVVSQSICSSVDYQQTLTATGWDARARWTSVYTVLANDLTFWLVPVYFVLLGVVFQRSLNAWRQNQDAASGASLMLIAIFFIYSSANMQLAITLDWAVATILFLYITPWRSLSRGRRPSGSGAPRAAV